MSEDKKIKEAESSGNCSGKGSSGISRRGFLAAAAAGGCAMAMAALGQATAAGSFRGWPDAYGMLTDFTMCVGCRSCEKACNQVNNMPAPEMAFDDPKAFDSERWPSSTALTVVNRYKPASAPDKTVYRKIQCNHCLEPACASACPIHAYTKTPEGAVIYDENLCFGCRYCVIACPFNIPGYTYESALEPKVVKCILCYSRIKEGKLPGCAEACPAGAITFGKREALLKIARNRIEADPKRYVDHIFGEKEAGGTSWLYLSAVPFEELGFPANLPDRPMVELTRSYTNSVPMIFTVFPALFGAVYMASRGRDEDKDKEHSKKEDK